MGDGTTEESELWYWPGSDEGPCKMAGAPPAAISCPNRACCEGESGTAFPEKTALLALVNGMFVLPIPAPAAAAAARTTSVAFGSEPA